MILSAIMSSPEFAEICFLIALILFAIATIVTLVRTEASGYASAIVAAGLSFIALAWLAL